jgi:hypothetical protein
MKVVMSLVLAAILVFVFCSSASATTDLVHFCFSYTTVELFDIHDPTTAFWVSFGIHVLVDQLEKDILPHYGETYYLKVDDLLGQVTIDLLVIGTLSNWLFKDEDQELVSAVFFGTILPDILKFLLSGGDGPVKVRVSMRF